MIEHVLTGSCHCGNLRIRLETSLAAGDFKPRACDCSFCGKHGAAYISDPDGRLVIDVRDMTALQRYRQGSESADFLLCRHCGVLVAVIYDNGGIRYGAVNSGCLDDRANLAAAQPASPQQLAPEDRQRRWQALWTANVEIISVGT